MDARFQRFGKLLQRKRLTAGLRQTDISKALGYATPQFISSWERGIAAPPEWALPILSRVLQIPASEIVNEIYRAELASVENRKRHLAEFLRGTGHRGRSSSSSFAAAANDA